MDDLVFGDVLGDYSGNGTLDSADLDLQAQGIQDGNLAYDLNHDDLVNYEDRQVWVIELKRTYIGDSDLNGEFTSGDLVGVFVAGKYEADLGATWDQGDWNGDQVFSSGDLVAAFQGGGRSRAKA